METYKDKERSSESSQYKVTSFTISFLSLSLKDWQGFRYSIVIKQIWKSHHLFLWEVDNADIQNSVLGCHEFSCPCAVLLIIQGNISFGNMHLILLTFYLFLYHTLVRNTSWYLHRCCKRQTQNVLAKDILQVKLLGLTKNQFSDLSKVWIVLQVILTSQRRYKSNMRNSLGLRC